jgi:imidazole glycerol-phosphate synthase subunit HisF
MLTRRIIACLDVDRGRVVKGVGFLNLRDAGDPAELAASHAAAGADEIVLLDISATHERRATLLETVRRTSARIFVPFTVGGGIASLDEAAAVFDAGADKISINSAALVRPGLIAEIAARFGSQAVIVAIDARRAFNAPDPVAAAEVYSAGGRVPANRTALEWALESERHGAGEILLTSMDSDGSRSGFDCELTALLATALNIPVIASGGAGTPAHFADVFTRGQADAALAASIFHYGIHDIADLKRSLAAAGISVRLSSSQENA